jgi:hypothetical protein
MWLVPLGGVVAALVAVVRRSRAALMLCVFAAACWNLARVRSDFIHLAEAAIPLLIVVPVFLGLRRTIVVGALALATMLALVTIRVILITPPACLRHSGMPDVDRRLGTACTTADELAVAALLARAPAVPLFVALPYHDRVVANDILLYVLAGRPSATLWYDFHPGVTTTAAVQTAILTDLRHNPETSVVGQLVTVPSEPNASAISSGVHLLDDYLRSAYEPDRRMGGYVILRPAARTDVRAATPP